MGEFVEALLEFGVADFVGEEVLELLAHVAGEASEEALHLAHLLLHPGDEFIERLRGVLAEEVAVLLHEAVEVGLLAGHLVLQHPVEVLRHPLEAVEVLGGHVGDLVGEVLEEGVHHGLAQGFDEFAEAGLGLGVHELIILEPADLSGGVFGEFVEELLLAVGDVAEHVGEFGVGDVALVLALAAGVALPAFAGLIPPALVGGLALPGGAFRRRFAVGG